MKKEYNSRQRKIYQDYNPKTSDALSEILKNRDNYISEVIEVVTDILIERGVIQGFTEPKAEVFIKEKDLNSRKFSDVDLSDEDSFFDEEKVRSYIKGLDEKSETELYTIISRYTSYVPELVNAALFVSVEKGIISYDLKETLLKQIKANLKDHGHHKGKFFWEQNNTFIEYVSGSQDDEIYEILENPKGIVIDVYHAFLVTAKNRELISAKDFTEYFTHARKSLRSDMEVLKDEIDTFIGIPETENLFENDAAIEEETGKFWKCPSCHQLVGMEFGQCWNCQTEIPEVVEHPDKEEVVKEKAAEKKFNPVKMGFYLVGAGVLLCLFSVFGKYAIHDRFNYHTGRIVESVIIIIAGVGFIIFGNYFDPKRDL